MVVQCTSEIVDCTRILYTLHCTMYNVQACYREDIVHYTRFLYTVQAYCTMYTRIVQCTLYSVQSCCRGTMCTLYSVHFTRVFILYTRLVHYTSVVYSVQAYYREDSIQCTLYSEHCPLYNVLACCKKNNAIQTAHWSSDYFQSSDDHVTLVLLRGFQGPLPANGPINVMILTRTRDIT